ncbi:MAG TPA: Uma2 family endonuclease [Pirellulales bacterium]|nr:Uma2 family endonuclease [Pirellulales bacterium]
MAPTSPIMTAYELIGLPSGEVRYELIRGKLHTMPLSGWEHGIVTAELSMQVATYVEKHDIGVVFAGGTGFQLEHSPDTVLAPDLAFVDRSRVPPTGVPEGYWQGPPDLAVEVLSPDDSTTQVNAKTDAWLSHGAGEVWLVDPKKRTVSIHRPAEAPVVLTENDSLASGLLPGFSCGVAEIFPPSAEAS